jgi:hypothetical protein
VLATASKEVTGNQTSLVCRVPTHWNSEKDCIDAHCHLKPIVLLITGDPKLKAFKLSDEQWALEHPNRSSCDSKSSNHKLLGNQIRTNFRVLPSSSGVRSVFGNYG